MEKQKVTVPIGNTKALIFEADVGDDEAKAFGELCEQVASTKPQSLQDFFTRLLSLQKEQPLRMHKGKARKM